MILKASFNKNKMKISQYFMCDQRKKIINMIKSYYKSIKIYFY
jgi:hypothetical protein